MVWLKVLDAVEVGLDVNTDSVMITGTVATDFDALLAICRQGFRLH